MSYNVISQSGSSFGSFKRCFHTWNLREKLTRLHDLNSNSYKFKGRSSASFSTDNTESVDVVQDFNATAISWYPGHIAKAERELADYLKKVDVVIEVRDARIPYTTTHPLVPTWVGSKPLIVAIARLDQISPTALREWKAYYSSHPAYTEKPDSKVYFVDGKLGKGISALKREALAAGDAINARRIKRGIAPRAVRAAVIGFPNVGKSALINRLLGRKLAKSRNLPGVTRNLQWIRIGGIDNSQEGSLELLDSPGIIPAKQVDQSTAIKLAICNDIGEASYDRIVVAGVMCDHLNALNKLKPAYVDMKTIKHRLKIPFDQMTGEEIVYELGETVYHGNHFAAADKLLGDFRRNMFNYGSLERPLFQRFNTTKPKVLIDLKDQKSAVQYPTNLDRSSDKLVGKGSDSDLKQEKQSKVIDTSKSTKQEELEKIIMSPLDVGKGNYDGW